MDLGERLAAKNNTVFTALQYQLGNQTFRDPALPRWLAIDAHINCLEGLQDSQNQLQKTATSLDLIQMSIDRKLKFLDSDLLSHMRLLRTPRGGLSSQMSNH